MDHPLLTPGSTAQWAQMEHETAEAGLTGHLGALGKGPTCVGHLLCPTSHILGLPFYLGHCCGNERYNNYTEYLLLSDGYLLAV